MFSAISAFVLSYTSEGIEGDMWLVAGDRESDHGKDVTERETGTEITCYGAK